MPGNTNVPIPCQNGHGHNGEDWVPYQYLSREGYPGTFFTGSKMNLMESGKNRLNDVVTGFDGMRICS
jgi:hypothetical protein